MNEHQMAWDFIQVRMPVMYDAISASQQMRKSWGVRIDWHVFAEVLDRMEQKGMAKRTGRNYDRFTEYQIGEAR